MGTEKLYLDDSLLLDFEATVVATGDYEGRPSILLDRSAFYGEAGGQLGDRGRLTIGDRCFAVEDCRYDKENALHHLVDGPVTAIHAGASATGKVAFDHRRDMMSQHTGQHLLSAVFAKLPGAKTVSSRLGAQYATLDLKVSDLSESQLQRVSDRANDLVLEDRPVRPLYPSGSELAAMPLRRTVKVRENIRVLEIEGFDFTPCGGTHCSSTGRIGPIFILNHTRYKGMTRVTFLAGKRALEHHRHQNQRLNGLGEQLGCGAAGVEELVIRIQADLRECHQQLGQARAALMQGLTERLHRENPPAGGAFTPILVIREREDLASLRLLATTLARRPDVVALVIGKDPKSGDWRATLERGERADFHAGSWFKTRASRWGARGGGRPERAEGGFPAATDWREVEKAFADDARSSQPQ